MRLAVIPARGGSQRVPRKNIRDFCGRPMLAWALDAVRASGCFERVVVSTDDAEIAAVARAHGAETPFLRPPELADAHAGTLPVVAHAIRWLTEHGDAPEFVCCVYATAVFLAPDDLRRGLTLLQTGDCDYAFAVTPYAAPIQRALRLIDAHRVAMFQPEHAHTRSQDLEPAYHDAAQFYWGRAAAWLAGKPVFTSASAPLILPRHRVQDIDTPDDWTRAEALFRTLRESPP